MVATVIIRVGSDDALWGHLEFWTGGGVTPQTMFEKKNNHYETIIIFSLKSSS